MWVWSLGWEDPLEEGMETHSIILAWKIPWTEEPGGLHTAHGVAKSRTQLKQLRVHIRTRVRAHTHTHTHALWLLTYFDVFLPLLMYILIYHINSLHLFSLYVAYFDLIIFSLCPFLFPLTGLKVLNFLTESKI